MNHSAFDMGKELIPREERVLEEFREGRLESFYETVYPSMLLFTTRFLGEQADFLAEDCVQDAVFDAWKRRDSFHSLQALKGFLYTSIRNDAISISRKEQARRRYLLSREEEVFFNTSVIDQETRALLYHALGELPGMERKVLEMSFVEGLKNIEIADKLALSDSSIKKYKANAIKILRQKLSRALLFLLLAGIS